MSMQKVGEHNRRPAGDGAGKRLLTGRPVGEATAQAQQPRLVLVALAAAGIVGPVVFAVVAVAQGLLRPSYSFVAQPVVALVAGPSGWVQNLNFVVLGAAIIAFAIGLQLGVRPTRWAVLGPRAVRVERHRAPVGRAGGPAPSALPHDLPRRRDRAHRHVATDGT